MLSRLLQTAGQGLPQQAGNPDLSYLMRGGQPQQGPQQTEGLGSLPGFAGQVYMDAISKMDAKLAKEEEAAKRKLMEAAQKRAQLKPPQPKQRGLADLLPVLALLAGGKLFNANNRDISGLLGGFMKGRNDYDQQRQAGEMARYEADRGALGDEMSLANMQYGWAKGDRDEFQKRRDAERGTMIADRRDERNFEQQKEVIGLQQQGRMTLEQAKQLGKIDLKRVDALKSMLSKIAPSARDDYVAEIYRQTGGNPPVEFLDAVQQLNADELLKEAKTQTENEMRPGMVAEKNAKARALEIINETLPERKKAELRNLGLTGDWIAEKVAHADQIFMLPLANLLMAERRLDLAVNSDRRAALKPQMDAIKFQINGHSKRLQKINEELSKIDTAFLAMPKGTLEGETANQFNFLVSRKQQLEAEKGRIEADAKRLDGRVNEMVGASEGGGGGLVSPNGFGAVPPGWGTPPPGLDIQPSTPIEDPPKTKTKAKPAPKPKGKVIASGKVGGGTYRVREK